MSTDDNLQGAIAALYEAVVSGGTWRGALEDVCDLLGLDELCWVVWDKQLDRVTRLETAGRAFSHAVLSGYQQHYVHSDPLRIRLEQAAAGTLVNMDREASREELARNPYVQELLIPAGAGRLAGLVALDTDRTLSGIGLHRAVRRDGIADQEERLIEALYPHLRRISRIERRLLQARQAAAVSQRALDLLPFGLALVDPLGRLRFANEWLLAKSRLGDGLAIVGGRLTGARHSTTERFDGLMVSLLRGDPRALPAASLTFPRPSGEAAWQVTVVSLADNRTWQAGDGAMILVSDPNDHAQPSGRQLIALYGLSPTEAQLALMLLEGLTLKAVAERRRVAITTVRTQLSRLLAKTGTSRQSELMRLLASISAMPKGR